MKKSKSKAVKLVKFDGKELRVGTLLVAEGFGRRHANIVRLIEKYRTVFQNFGSLNEQKSKSTGGRPVVEYLLNEPQTAFLGTLFKNNDQVIAFKETLVKEFYRMKETLAKIGIQRNDPNWQQIRQEGKPDRLSLTDALKPLRLLAIEQNPKTAYKDNEETIYQNYTKMIYKALFYFNIPVRKVREFLNESQLRDLANVEIIISKLIVVLTLAELHYKKTYISAKEKVEAYGELIGKTKVIEFNPQLQLF